MPNTSSSQGGGGQAEGRSRSRNRSRNRNRNRNRDDNRNRSNSDHSDGGGSNRNRDRSRKRNRSGRDRRSDSDDQDRRGAGHRTGGYTREKVPRRAPQPSLWNRFLAIFGLGGTKPAAEPAAPKAASKSQAKPRSDRQERNPASTKRERPAKEKRASRAPERVEVTGPRLYVGNLSYDATEEDLEQLFSGVGGVESAEVVTHKQSQRSKGFAFVVLRSVDEAKRAVEVLHDQEFMGRKITVSGAKSSGPASGSSSSSSA